MTSKISSFKLIKSDLKNRAWMVILLGMVFLVAQPMQLILRLTREHRYEELYSSYPETYVPQYEEIAAQLTGMGNGKMLFLMLGAAILCAFTGFYYAQSKGQLDFYHSLPLTRLQMYRVFYFSGALMFVLPFSLGTLLSWGIVAVNGLSSSSLLYSAIQTYVINLLEFLTFYGLAILGIMLTGKMIATVMAVAVMAVYPTLVLGIYRDFLGNYFVTYVYQGEEIYTQTGTISQLLAEFFSPWQVRSGIEAVFPIGVEDGIRGLLLLLFLIIQVIGINVLAAYLYKIRRTEAVNHVMAFPKMEGIIKILLVVPAALMVGMSVADYLEGDEGWVFMISCLLAVILLSCVIEFSYQFDISACLKRKWSILVSAGLCGLLFLCCRFDWIGYNKYLPPMEQIESMSFCYGGINGDFSYKTVQTSLNSSASYYSDYYGLDRMDVYDFEPLYRLAQEGVAQLNNKDVWEGFGETSAMVSVKYSLKSGRSVYRQYGMRKQVIDEQLKKVLEDKNVRMQMYPIFSWKESGIRDVNLMDMTKGEDSDILSVNVMEHAQEFLDSYREELLEAEYEDLLTTHYRMDIGVENGENGFQNYYGYPIGEGFPKTMSLLNGLQ